MKHQIKTPLILLYYRWRQRAREIQGQWFPNHPVLPDILWSYHVSFAPQTACCRLKMYICAWSFAALAKCEHIT